LYRYSQRLPWAFSSNPLTRSIQEKRRAQCPLLDLTVSNPTQAFDDYPHTDIRAIYSDVNSYIYEPDPAGLESARIAVSNWYGKRGISLSPANLLLTASTSEAYALLLKLFCDPGDEILVPLPSYPLFEFLAALEAVRIVPYRLRYDGAWFVDFDTLRANIGPRTGAIVVVNPNNPTGSFLKRSESHQLFSLADEYNLPVISDEVFMQYPLANSPDCVRTFIGNDSGLNFSLNGLSKIAGMPQMKLGWIAINGPAADRQIARDRLELLLDTYLSVNTPVQRALPGLLDLGAQVEERIRDRAVRNLASGQEILRNTAAHFLHAEGGWSAIVQLPSVLSEEAWALRLLDEYNIIVQPGYFFDMGSEAYVVVSLIAPPDQFDEGLRRLAHLVSSEC